MQSLETTITIVLAILTLLIAVFTLGFNICDKMHQISDEHTKK